MYRQVLRTVSFKAARSFAQHVFAFTEFHRSRYANIPKSVWYAISSRNIVVRAEETLEVQSVGEELHEYKLLRGVEVLSGGTVREYRYAFCQGYESAFLFGGGRSTFYIKDRDRADSYINLYYA